jgi:hypothetical protein
MREAATSGQLFFSASKCTEWCERGDTTMVNSNNTLRLQLAKFALHRLVVAPAWRDRGVDQV